VSTDWVFDKGIFFTFMGAANEDRVETLLEAGAPYAYETNDPPREEKRFLVCSSTDDGQHLHVVDNHRNLTTLLPVTFLDDYQFNVCDWYQCRLTQLELDRHLLSLLKPIPADPLDPSEDSPAADEPLVSAFAMKYAKESSELMDPNHRTISLQAAQVDRNKLAAIQRNSASVKDKTRLVPKTVVLKVRIQGHLVRAMVDSGSQGDFLSTTLADQLSLGKAELKAPLKLQLAVQGSRSVIKYGIEARFQFEGIDELRKFDMVNLSNYDGYSAPPGCISTKCVSGSTRRELLLGVISHYQSQITPIRKHWPMP
jgi:hypothetical protein